MRAQSLREHYDVVVVGGGMVGASFALALTQQCTPRILVVESMLHAAMPSGSQVFDARTTALSHGSRLIYEKIGLWERIGPTAEPILKIHVSDRGHFGATRLDAAALKVPALGYVAENHVLGEVLQSAVEQADDIDFCCPARISCITPTAAGMQLQVGRPGQAAESQISADLVVLADGGKSNLTEQLGIQASVTHYEQSALITNIAFTQPHHNVAYERFTDTGPVAVLPLPDAQGTHRGSLIWTLPRQDVAEVLELSESAFLNALQERFGRRLGTLTRAGSPVVYPLSLSVAREQIRPGLVLLGNVAHTLHPVAGQGMNLALRDAQVLAGVIRQALEKGLSPGSMDALGAYTDAQHSDQQRTIQFSHYMTKLFSSSNPALVWARKFGLFSVDLVPTVKQGFARQAMGMAARSAQRFF
jgi:2-octaprenyl-6-methoxyphenol hydroxylase